MLTMLQAPDRRPLGHENGIKSNVASIQSALEELRLSREEAAELQGYIKRVLEEEKTNGRECRVEPLILARFQNEWAAWGDTPLDKARTALRDCVAALRQGIPLVQLPVRPQSPRSPTAQESEAQDTPLQLRTHGGSYEIFSEIVNPCILGLDPGSLAQISGSWNPQLDEARSPPNSSLNEVTDGYSSFSQQALHDDIQQPSSPMLRRSDPGPVLARPPGSAVSRPASLPTRQLTRPVRTPPPWRPKHSQQLLSPVDEPKLTPLVVHQAPARQFPVGVVRTKVSHFQDANLDPVRPAPTVISTKRRPHAQTGDAVVEEDCREHHIRQVRGLMHDVLEVRDVVTGRPTLIIAEHNQFGLSSTIEYVEEDDEDSPILGDALLLPYPSQGQVGTDAGKDSPDRPAPLVIVTPCGQDAATNSHGLTMKNRLLPAGHNRDNNNNNNSSNSSNNNNASSNSSRPTNPNNSTVNGFTTPSALDSMPPQAKIDQPRPLRRVNARRLRQSSITIPPGIATSSSSIPTADPISPADPRPIVPLQPGSWPPTTGVSSRFLRLRDDRQSGRVPPRPPPAPSPSQSPPPSTRWRSPAQGPPRGSDGSTASTAATTTYSSSPLVGGGGGGHHVVAAP